MFGFLNHFGKKEEKVPSIVGEVSLQLDLSDTSLETTIGGLHFKIQRKTSSSVIQGTLIRMKINMEGAKIGGNVEIGGKYIVGGKEIQKDKINIDAYLITINGLIVDFTNQTITKDGITKKISTLDYASVKDGAIILKYNNQTIIIKEDKITVTG